MIEVIHVVLLDLLLYLLILLIGYNCMQTGKISKSQFVLTMFLFVIFCLYPAWGGDYFHYRESFQYVRQGYGTHMEDVYVYIIQNITSTYFMFRLVVWGGASYILYKAYKNTEVDTYLSILIFSLLFLPRFSYARVSLAMALTFLGMSLLTYKKGFRNYLLGILVLVGSFFFHKSALFGIGVVLVSIFLYDRIGKKTLVAVLISFPVLIVVATNFLSDFLLLDAEDFEMINVESGQNYLTDEVANKGIAARIIDFLMRATYYLIAIEYLIIQFKGQYKTFPRSVKAYATASFFSIVFASIFAFDLGVSTQTIYSRFIFFGMIPSAVFVAYCVKEKLYPKWTRLVIAMGIASMLFSLLYACYLAQNSHYTW